MALNIIGSIGILKNGYAAPFLINTIIKCFWDDVLNQVRYQVYDIITDVFIQEVTTGPTINGNMGWYGTQEIAIINNRYKKCTGTTLTRWIIPFVPISFPYVTTIVEENHYLCQFNACDLDFEINAIRVREDSGSGNGYVTVRATTSNGSIRFSLDDNDSFATAPYSSINGTYTISSLPAGSYTVYAIDSLNCKASVFVVVPLADATTYGLRWHTNYPRINRSGEREIIEIEEKNYSGGITDVKTTGNRAAISWRGESIENPFTAVLPSEIVLDLISETNFQFLDLFTQDEKKYRVKKYDQVGAGVPVLKWVGFIVPAVYSEPYIRQTNYPIQITATDQLADLKNYDFVDDFGNAINSDISLIKAIAIILRKTKLGLNIYESVNIFPDNVDPESLTLDFIDDKNDIPWTNYAGDDMIEPRPDVDAVWPAGDYEIKIEARRDGAGQIEVYLYGFDTAMGAGAVSFGLVATLTGTYATYTNTITVGTAKQYIGFRFVKVSGYSNLEMYSLNITKTPIEYTSSLQTVHIDPTIYEDKDCLFTLNSILTSIGSRIYLAENQWRIEFVEQQTGSISYRLFDEYGAYLSDSQETNVVAIRPPKEGDINFINQSALLTITPSYNRIVFTINTGLKNNLLRGDFERSDILNDDFRGFSIDISNGDGIVYGYEEFEEPRSGSEGGLFLNFNTLTESKYAIISPTSFYLSKLSGGEYLRLTFDVLFRPVYKDMFTYLDISLTVGGTVILEDKREFFDKTDTWNSVTVDLPTVVFGLVGGVLTYIPYEGLVELSIKASNIPMYEFDTITALKNAVYYPKKKRDLVRVKSGTFLHSYKYNKDTGVTEDLPRIVKGIYSYSDIYGVQATNDYYWELETTFELPNEANLLYSLVIDNIRMWVDTVYPKAFEYSKANNEDINVDFNQELNHSDLGRIGNDFETPGSLLSNTNYQRVVKNYFRFSDGTPTSTWKRLYTDESRSINDILMRVYQAQLTTPSFKLTGTAHINTTPTFKDAFYVPFINRYFLPMFLSVAAFNNTIDVELIEIKTGEGGEPPSDIYEFTEEFTTESNA